MFCWIPIIIDVFEEAFEERKMLEDKKNKIRKTVEWALTCRLSFILNMFVTNYDVSGIQNAIIASFIMLDFDGNNTIDRHEFEYLVSSSVLIDRDKLFKVFDENKNEELEIYEFVHSLLKESFWSKVLSSRSIPQSKFESWCECNIFRREYYYVHVFVFLVLPVIALALIKGMQHPMEEQHLDNWIYAFSLANMAEIHCRMFCIGIYRFWDLLKYPNPKYVVAAIDKYKMESIGKRADFIEDNTFGSLRLTSSQREWATRYLRAARPYSILEKHTISLINRMEVIVFWVCFGFFFMMFLIGSTLNGVSEVDRYYLNQYILVFPLIAVLMRIFTVLPTNRELLYVVFSVLKKFIYIFYLWALFIYFWARMGCACFGDNQKDIVLDDVYDAADGMIANFNTLGYAILTLIQLMIGEGWHEIVESFFSKFFVVFISN